MGVSSSLLACQSDTGTKQLQRGHGKDMRRGLFLQSHQQPPGQVWWAARG